MRAGEPVFVDTGAWIALALTADPLHARARETWEQLLGAGVVLHTSVSVALETFTFLDRHARRGVALIWKDSLKTVRRLKILPSTAKISNWPGGISNGPISTSCPPSMP